MFEILFIVYLKDFIWICMVFLIIYIVFTDQSAKEFQVFSTACPVTASKVILDGDRLVRFDKRG